MLNRILALTALTVTLGSTSAMAQTAYTNTGLPGGWEGSVSEAFYSDTTAGTLRADSEIRSNWDGMNEADRASVLDYCAGVDMGQSDATGGMQTNQAEDQTQRTEQMAGDGTVDGVTTIQAEDQTQRTEQMGDAGAAAGQSAGVAAEPAQDQAQQSAQMGDEGGTAPGAGADPLSDTHAASASRICDIVATK